MNDKIQIMIFTYKTGRVENTSLPFIAGQIAGNIREHSIARIEVEIINKVVRSLLKCCKEKKQRLSINISFDILPLRYSDVTK